MRVWKMSRVQLFKLDASHHARLQLARCSPFESCFRRDLQSCGCGRLIRAAPTPGMWFRMRRDHPLDERLGAQRDEKRSAWSSRFSCPSMKNVPQGTRDDANTTPARRIDQRAANIACKSVAQNRTN